MPVDSELYREHIERLKNGELCWRYTKRFGHISKTTIYQNEQQKICMRGEILGSNDIITTEHFKIHPQLEREIIDGVVLKDYITAKQGMKEVVGELRQYTDFIFETFATENPEMIQGMAYDAFPYNCILTEGHVYELFDLEFEYKEALDRGYMLYKIVRVLGKKRRKMLILNYANIMELYQSGRSGMISISESGWIRFQNRMILRRMKKIRSYSRNILSVNAKEGSVCYEKVNN